MQQRSRPWKEVIVGVLGIDASLKRVPSQDDVILQERQALTCCHLEVESDSVSIVHRLEMEVFLPPL